jgi:hypothetical protein
MRVEQREQRYLTRRGEAVKASQYAHHERIRRSAQKEYLRSLDPKQRVRENPDGTTVTEVVTGQADMRCPVVEMQAMKAQRDLLGLDVQAAENPFNDVSLEIEELEARAITERAAYEREKVLREEAESARQAPKSE